MDSWITPKHNHLLALLPEDYYEQLLPNLEPIFLEQGTEICDSGARLSHAYFPTTTIVSLLHVTENGDTAEIAITGNDGFVGIALAMGGDTTPNQAVVNCAGHAYRLKASMLKKELMQHGPLQELLLRYTQSLITQMSLTAVCNRYHSIEQQLCRRLLLGLDRLQTNHLDLTHENIANMLGVRREGVTQAARKLQAAGLIHYARGHITVLDREELEEHACECYSVVKNECDRLMPAKKPQPQYKSSSADLEYMSLETSYHQRRQPATTVRPHAS